MNERLLGSSLEEDVHFESARLSIKSILSWDYFCVVYVLLTVNVCIRVHDSSLQV